MIKPIEYLDLSTCLLSKPENIGKDFAAPSHSKDFFNFLLLNDPSDIQSLYLNSYCDHMLLLRMHRNSFRSLKAVILEKDECHPHYTACRYHLLNRIAVLSINISDIHRQQLGSVLNALRKSPSISSLKLQWRFFQTASSSISPLRLLTHAAKYLKHLHYLEIDWLDFLNEHESEMLSISDLFTIKGLQSIKTFKCSSIYVDQKKLMKLVSYKRGPVYSFNAESIDVDFAQCELLRTIRIDFPVFPNVKRLKLNLSDVHNPTKLFKSLFFKSKPLHLNCLHIIDSESADIDLKYVFDMLDPSVLSEFHFKSSNIQYDNTLFRLILPELPSRFPNLKEITLNGLSFFYLLYQNQNLPINTIGPKSFVARIDPMSNKKTTDNAQTKYIYLKNHEVGASLPIDLLTGALETLSLSKVTLNSNELRSLLYGPHRVFNLTRIELKKAPLEGSALHLILSSDLMKQIEVLKLESLQLPLDYMRIFKANEDNFQNLQELSLRDNKMYGSDFELLFSISMPILSKVNLIDTELKPPKSFLAHLNARHKLCNLQELYISVDMKKDALTLDQIRSLTYFKRLQFLFMTNRYYEITQEMMKHKQLRKIATRNYASGYRYEDITDSELITTLQESLDSYLAEEFLF